MNVMTEPKLIIFDCDGVLIDSEALVCALVSEELTRHGYPITPDEVIRRFAGRPEREMVAEIEQQWGQSIPTGYFNELARRVHEAYTTELQAIDGVDEVLAAIRIPFCVASSSDPDKLKLGLGFVNLYHYFDPHVISAKYVAQGKPAPDVFIYAAGSMRTPVRECVVVEDSIPGVKAAVAAGMPVIGFTGGSHCPPGHDARLRDAGAYEVIADMRELPSLAPNAFAGVAVGSLPE